MRQVLAKNERRVRTKGKETLRNVLRDAFRIKGRRRDVRIIETKCMGICPKKAATALNASQPDRILTVPKAIATDVAMAQLMNETEQ